MAKSYDIAEHLLIDLDSLESSAYSALVPLQKVAILKQTLNLVKIINEKIFYDGVSNEYGQGEPGVVEEAMC